MWKGVLYNLYNSCDNSNKINQVDLIEKKNIYSLKIFGWKPTVKKLRILLENWFQTILRRLQMIFWSCNCVAHFRIWRFGRWWRGNFHILDNGSSELYQFSAIRSHFENWFSCKIKLIFVRGCVICIALSSAISNSGFTKAVTYDERPKMKRDNHQKSSTFPQKKTALYKN